MHVSGIGGGERLFNAGFLLVAVWVLPVTAAAREPGDQPERLPVTGRRSHIQSIGEMRKPEPVGRVAAFGLELSRAPEILRRQLALSRGEGLVVDAVSPQSAADRIGIQPHDVLVRLDDQLLVLPEQLAVLLEAIPLPSAEVSPAETIPPGGIMTVPSRNADNKFRGQVLSFAAGLTRNTGLIGEDNFPDNPFDVAAAEGAGNHSIENLFEG